MAGGIPIVRSISLEGLAADQILSMAGIINGTANYILSTMTETGMGVRRVPFAEAQGQVRAEHASRGPESSISRWIYGPQIGDLGVGWPCGLKEFILEEISHRWNPAR